MGHVRPVLVAMFAGALKSVALGVDKLAITSDYKGSVYLMNTDGTGFEELVTPGIVCPYMPPNSPYSKFTDLDNGEPNFPAVDVERGLIFWSDYLGGPAEASGDSRTHWESSIWWSAMNDAGRNIVLTRAEKCTFTEDVINPLSCTVSPDVHDRWPKSDAESIFGIALDTGNQLVYYCDRGGSVEAHVPHIGVVSYDGVSTPPTKILIPSGYNNGLAVALADRAKPYSVALDVRSGKKKIYWTGYSGATEGKSRIWRADLSMDLKPEIFQNISVPNSGLEIDTVNEYIYWSQYTGIHRCRLSGCDWSRYEFPILAESEYKKGKNYPPVEEDVYTEARVKNKYPFVLQETDGEVVDFALDVSGGKIYFVWKYKDTDTSRDDAAVRSIDLDGKNMVVLHDTKKAKVDGVEMPWEPSGIAIAKSWQGSASPIPAPGPPVEEADVPTRMPTPLPKATPAATSDSPTKAPTAAPTMAPQTVVTLGFGINGLDYNAMTDVAIEGTKNCIRASILAENDNLTSGDIEVELSEGSVAVLVTIVVPDTSTEAAVSLQSGIESSVTLTASIIAKVSVVPGISVATTGALSASVMTVAVEVRAAPTSLPTTSPTQVATPAPTKHTNKLSASFGVWGASLSSVLSTLIFVLALFAGSSLP